MTDNAPPAERTAELERAEQPRTATGALQTYLEQRAPQLARWTGERLAPESLIRFALLDYQRSPQLQRCSHASIYLALIACAQVGLEPGGVRQEAFIVPYRDKRLGDIAQFQLGYRGVIELARRSGMVSRVVGNVVYEADSFDFDEGSEPFVRHKRALGDRGDLVAAYAYAALRDGELELEVMGRDDLDKIEQHATRANTSPAWKGWRDQMLRKAPIRRLGKRLPLGDDYARAMQIDGAAAGGDLRAYQHAIGETEIQLAPEAAAAAPGRGTEAIRNALRRGKQ